MPTGWVGAVMADTYYTVPVPCFTRCHGAHAPPIWTCPFCPADPFGCTHSLQTPICLPYLLLLHRLYHPTTPPTRAFHIPPPHLPHCSCTTPLHFAPHPLREHLVPRTFPRSQVHVPSLCGLQQATALGWGSCPSFQTLHHTLYVAAVYDSLRFCLPTPPIPQHHCTLAEPAFITFYTYQPVPVHLVFLGCSLFTGCCGSYAFTGWTDAFGCSPTHLTPHAFTRITHN